jgi:hypothetical protein
LRISSIIGEYDQSKRGPKDVPLYVLREPVGDSALPTLDFLIPNGID